MTSINDLRYSNSDWQYELFLSKADAEYMGYARTELSNMFKLVFGYWRCAMALDKNGVCENENRPLKCPKCTIKNTVLKEELTDVMNVIVAEANTMHKDLGDEGVKLYAMFMLATMKERGGYFNYEVIISGKSVTDTFCARELMRMCDNIAYRAYDMRVNGLPELFCTDEEKPAEVKAKAKPKKKGKKK
jgi:hypothetical protein